MVFRYLTFVSNEMRSLLRNRTNTMWLRSQPKSKFKTTGGGTGALFKLQTIKENWESIPIFITAFIAAMLPVGHSVFRFMNSEDLRLWPGTKMKSQKHRWILEGPPKPTLYMVVNQKWEWPQGLLDALREDGNQSGSTSDDGNGINDKCKKVSLKKK